MVKRSSTTIDEKVINTGATKATVRRSARNPKTPSTMERTGTLRSSANYEDDDDEAFTPE